MEKNAAFTNGYALLIGVGNYPNPGITPLPVTENDATVLYNILTDPSRAGYPPEQVKLLVNEDATKQGITAGLDWLAGEANKNPNATVIIYYSGHGGTKGDEFILIPYDFEWPNWKEHSISNTDFVNSIERLTSVKRLVVILDCCHAAGIATKSSIKNDFTPSNQALYDQLKKGRGKVIVASCRSTEYSHIRPGARYSVFTDALVDALDGQGANNTNYATVLNTFARVSDSLKGIRIPQTPVYNMYNVEDFTLCRVNSAFATKHPFKETEAYRRATPQPVEDSVPASNVRLFITSLLSILDERGFAGVATVLENIKQSGFHYDKPAYANLRNDALSNLSVLSPNDYINRLKVFIGMLN